VNTSDAVRQAIEAARSGRKTEARDMLLKVVEADPYNEIAWLWLSGLVDTLEDRIIACENVLTINPSNEKVKAYLSQLRHKQSLEEEKIPPIPPLKVETPLKARTQSAPVQQDAVVKEAPLQRAARLEQEGKYNEALEIYRVQAGTVKDSVKFDEIYKQIVRIENLQKEKIRYISPGLTILRLTFTWPLVYFFFVLLHDGFNPIAHPTWTLWLGLPVVIAGSFLLAVSEIRSHHAIWKKLFNDDGDGSSLTRLVAAGMGWALIIFPHAFLVLNALLRLRNLAIPPEPF
jgi:hypothetical protein